jgi:hypothetical protein
MHDFQTTPDAETLRDARIRARLSIPEAAELAAITPRSWRLQELGRRRASICAYRLLLCRAGWLPDPAWHGWSIGQGKLWTPENWSISPGELRALPYLYAQLAESRRLLNHPIPSTVLVASNVVPFRR